eukprot:356120-Chlamydomonas_euryale.AAC.15
MRVRARRLPVGAVLAATRRARGLMSPHDPIQRTGAGIQPPLNGEVRESRGPSRSPDDGRTASRVELSPTQRECSSDGQAFSAKQCCEATLFAHAMHAAVESRHTGELRAAMQPKCETDE